MAQIFIEHVNITVSNPDETAAYLMRLFDWHIRWRGHAAKGGNTIHAVSYTHLTLPTNREV